MLVNKYIKKFIYILQLLIIALLFSYYFIDIKNLLNKAKNIENMKTKHSSQLPKAKKIYHIEIKLKV